MYWPQLPYSLKVADCILPPEAYQAYRWRESSPPGGILASGALGKLCPPNSRRRLYSRMPVLAKVGLSQAAKWLAWPVPLPGPCGSTAFIRGEQICQLPFIETAARLRRKPMCKLL